MGLYLQVHAADPQLVLMLSSPECSTASRDRIQKPRVTKIISVTMTFMSGLRFVNPKSYTVRTGKPLSSRWTLIILLEEN